jgi:hypothetical protein
MRERDGLRSRAVGRLLLVRSRRLLSGGAEARFRRGAAVSGWLLLAVGGTGKDERLQAYHEDVAAVGGHPQVRADAHEAGSVELLHRGRLGDHPSRLWMESDDAQAGVARDPGRNPEQAVRGRR